MAKLNDTISFRLAPEFLKVLNEEAVKEGKTTNLCARRLLIRTLTDSSQTELRAEIDKLQRDFRKMRGDFATLGAHLLVKIAKEKPAEAENWVRENLAP